MRRKPGMDDPHLVDLVGRYGSRGPPLERRTGSLHELPAGCGHLTPVGHAPPHDPERVPALFGGGSGDPEPAARVRRLAQPAEPADPAPQPPAPAPPDARPAL